MYWNVVHVLALALIYSAKGFTVLPISVTPPVSSAANPPRVRSFPHRNHPSITIPLGRPNVRLQNAGLGSPLGMVDHQEHKDRLKDSETPFRNLAINRPPLNLITSASDDGTIASGNQQKRISYKKGGILKIIAERYVVTFRRRISKMEFQQHISILQALIAAEIQKGAKSVEGESPKLKNIFNLGPSKRLPNGFRGYIAVLTQTIIETLQNLPGIHIVLDYKIKYNLGNLTSDKSFKRHRVLYRRNVVESAHTLEKQQLSLNLTESNWGLDRIDQPSGRDGVYKYHSAAGDSVRAIVLDSGITPHFDFQSRVLPGKNFVEGERDDDELGHGSFVASLIGSAKVGVAKKVILQSYKMIGASSSSWHSELISSLYTLSSDVSIFRRRGEDVVINMSFGIDEKVEENSPLHEVEFLLLRMIEDGAILVQAAGNNNVDGCDQLIMRIPEVIKVGAIDENDKKIKMSNYGTCIDIFAPGENVLGYDSLRKKFELGEGTSFAAPFVTGTIAIFLATGNFDHIASEERADILRQEIRDNAWKLDHIGEEALTSFQSSVPRILNSLPSTTDKKQRR